MYGSNFILLYAAVQFSHLHSVKRMSIPYCIFLPLCHRLFQIEASVLFSFFNFFLIYFFKLVGG